MINPKSKTLGDLYKTNAILTVPNYQRSFDWGKSEVMEMMVDLKAAMESESQMFLGTVVFDVSDQRIHKIVDGQQRITSYTLLLIACREQAKRINNERLAQEIQKKISFTDESTAEMISERVKVSPGIGDIFTYIADERWGGDFPAKIGDKHVKRQTNKIKSLYEYLMSEISEFGQKELSSFLKTIYSTYVLEIDIEDPLEAFDIFERTNARGLSLNVADLLKNYLYANAEHDQDIEEQWNELTNLAGPTLQRMIKYFWVSQHGYVKKRDLYRKLKKYGSDVGAARLTGELSNFARYYAAIQSDDVAMIRGWLQLEGCETIAHNNGYLQEVSAACKGLNHFSITQHYPLIYSITQSYKKSGMNSTSTKMYLRLLSNIEKYHFVNNQVCERVGNEIEKPYAEFAAKYSATNDFIGTSEELIALLKKKRATREEFISRFVELDYQSLSLPETCYIFDRVNNHDLKATEWVKIYDPDKSILKNDFNTEHFFPQNPDFDADPEDMEAVDNIGNLFIISRHTNSKLQNRSPKEKIALLEDRGRKFRYVVDFVQKFKAGDGKWGKKEILERAQALADDAYSKVWVIK